MRFLSYSQLLAVLLIGACGTSDSISSPTIETTIHRQDTLSSHSTPTLFSSPLEHLELDSIMQGVWFSDTNENALFYIEEDTLVYVEHLDRFHQVAFAHDTITFLLDDGYEASSIVRIINERTILMVDIPDLKDSLILFRHVD